jgi:hypothetical protein
MSSNTLPAIDLTDDGTGPVSAAVGDILGCRPDAVTAIFRGRNSRVFRIDAGAERFAAKFYGTSATDGRDRLGTEYGGLAFLVEHGVDAVPKPVAYSRDANCGVYQWIDGAPYDRPGASDIDQALAFVAALHGARTAAAASALPLASEACLSGDDIRAQVEGRRRALLSRAESHAGLADFLERRFAPAFGACVDAARETYTRIALSFSEPLESALTTLSQSDFGFHNAIRRSDGTAAFVDFEYFGWDDPVKLACDFVLHPAMDLDDDMKSLFLDGVSRIFADDAAFGQRLRALIPLYGLRWCMILLNEFRDDRWHQRLTAGVREDRSAVEKRQLAKAETLLSRLVEKKGVFQHG